MFPQTHAIIASLIYDDVFRHHRIKLNKTQLIYGSIKPDLYSGLPKLKHFKPQSFSTICQEITVLSQKHTPDNKAAIAALSQKIGIVTHYIADYFCVPHNDRKTYQHHFINHCQYEAKLHQMFKHTIHTPNNIRNNQWIDFSQFDQVTGYLDDLHSVYQSRSESYLNDLNSSVHASRSVGLMVVQQSMCHTEALHATA
ncbi:zinc dependent phospholipase C family protein [Anoxynatronum sibiricum]|uniref:Zinc dependent phospholipase C family protein n=1 Tax=Anoxynatronum sibiricum TaxID=210623 RepID=A0ABU9VX84_9CLOT